MTIDAHAKINWTLQVLGSRPDGYHEIRSVVLPIPLHDTVTLEEDNDISCGMDAEIVRQEDNLAYRAATMLKAVSGFAGGVRIWIEKRIPVGAGLGGGSADAAAVLNGLNEMWGLDLSKDALCEVAARIGSDVPALVLGGAVMMEGRGERVRPLVPAEEETLPDTKRLVVEMSGIEMSTAKVYREFRDADRGLGPNDLQPAAIRLNPGIGDAIRRMEARGISRVTMTGSGSAIYGVDGISFPLQSVTEYGIIKPVLTKRQKV